jgi:outer membrane scaffolding protein for murein synthesis (MipA/OmpV family)
MNLRLTKGLRRSTALLFSAAIVVFAAVPAAAQNSGSNDAGEGDREGEERRRGYIVTVGAGAQAYPDFPGADSLGIYPMPIVGLRKEGRPVPLEAPDEGFGFGILGQDSPINFGPAVNFQRKRDEEDVGAAVGNVGWTVEAGGFVEALIGDNFRLRTEVRQGINGHEGLLADFGADLFVRSGDLSVFSIGPRVRWASDKYMDAYYGVTPARAVQTGLAAFDPDSGIHAVGAAAGMRLDIGGGLAVHAYTRYDRLMNDAADSPIVASFGSRNQFGAGAGLSYSFRVGGGSRR